MLIFFQNIFFPKILSSRVSNSLDPDQAPHFVRPDLGLNCLQKLSVDTLVGKELIEAEKTKKGHKFEPWNSHTDLS